MLKVVLGVCYRWFMDITKWLNIPTMTCYSVNRGQGLSPVVSCEGKFLIVTQKCLSTDEAMSSSHTNWVTDSLIICKMSLANCYRKISDIIHIFSL